MINSSPKRASAGQSDGTETSADAPVPRVAVTGGLGCGKSSLGRLLAERGAEVVDADDIVHHLQQPGGVLSAAVGREFGAEFLKPDGSVDRPRLAALVFANAGLLARLNVISHPPVRDWFRSWRGAPSNGWAKVALIPLLFESGWETDWDATVCVACRPEIQRERLRGRGWSDEEVRRRMVAQWPLDEKRRRADIVVDNSDGWDEFADAADALKQMILEKLQR